MTAEVSVSPADIEPKFQWYYNDENTTAGGVPIDGATGATYTITEDMIGKYIYVYVTAEKENYVTKVVSDIKKLYKVTYDNIFNDNSYPKTIIEGTNLNITFEDEIYNIAVKMSGNLLNSSDYNYLNKKLIVNNVIGDIEIISCVLDFAGTTSNNLFEFSSVNFTANSIVCNGTTSGGTDYIIIPITNLTLGSTYELTFSEVTNSLPVTDLEYMKNYHYGNFISSGFDDSTSVVWHTKENGIKENQKIKFIATSETMYWKWELSLFHDFILNEYKIYDISLNKIDNIYPMVNIENVNFVTNGTYNINLKNEMRLKFNATGGDYAEKINIPINNLEIGKKYKLSFSEYTDGVFYADSGNFHYGCSILSGVDNTLSKFTPTWICKETGWIEEQSITFTATETTMYWVWILEDIIDNEEYNFEFYNITVEECL